MQRHFSKCFTDYHTFQKLTICIERYSEQTAKLSSHDAKIEPSYRIAVDTSGGFRDHGRGTFSRR